MQHYPHFAGTSRAISATRVLAAAIPRTTPATQTAQQTASGHPYRTAAKVRSEFATSEKTAPLPVKHSKHIQIIS